MKRSQRIFPLLLFSIGGFWCIFLFGSLPRTIRQLKHESRTSLGNCPSTGIRDILQTSDGLFWFATGAGVIRYDGNRYDLFSNANTPEFKSGYAQCLAEGRDGTLWVGTGNGLLRLKGGKWDFFGSAAGIPGHAVEKIIVDNSKRLWIGTDNGLAFMDEKNRFQSIPRFQKTHIWDMMTMGKDALWVVAGKELLSIRHRQISPVFSRTKTGPVLAISADRHGGAWISTENGLFRYRDKQLYPVPLAVPLPGTILSPLFVTRSGCLWVGVRNRGIGRMIDGIIHIFGEKDGLSQKDIRTIYEDREGTIWVGTFNGLDRFSQTAFFNYTVRDGLPYRVVESICEDDTGGLWVGTQKGVARFSANGKQKTYLADRDIFSFLPVGNGRIWAGGNGLFALPVEFPEEQQLFQRFKNLKIFSMTLLMDKSRWIGTNHGLFRISKEGIQALRKEDGLAGDRIRVIRKAPDGSVWIGTDTGISHVTGQHSLRILPLKYSLNDQFVFEIFIERDGTIWVGTDFGLKRIRGQKIASLTVLQGLPSNKIYAIQPDSKGNFWISTGSGICSIPKSVLEWAMDGKNRKIHPRTFDKRDGLPVNSGLGGTQPVSWQDRTGKIWFATAWGLVGVDPNHIPKNTVPPNVRINRVAVDNHPVPISTPLRLKPGWKRLSIQYIGLSYKIPSRNRYRLILKGYDKNFETTKRREVAYTNLDPGTYTFKVYASNNDGVWSRIPATFRFTVLTPWWRSSWFLVALLIFSGLLVNFTARGIQKLWSIAKQWRSTHIFGKYRILEIVGRGGMGTVYRACTKKSDRIVALKILDVDASDEDIQKRFLREGELGEKIDHPNIVRIFDSGKKGNHLFYAMEFCNGIPLREVMENGMSIRSILAIGIVLCDALHHLHEKGIVHRDVKPENIMILQEDALKRIDGAVDPVSLARANLKLLDLGLARISGATTLTRTGLVAGTIMYVPPESLGGSKHATPAVDFYAVGIMLYEMVTGIAPYTGNDMAELLYAILYRVPTSPISVEPRVPGPVSEFIMKLIEKDLALRLTDYGEIRRNLMKLLTQH